MQQISMRCDPIALAKRFTQCAPINLALCPTVMHSKPRLVSHCQTQQTLPLSGTRHGKPRRVLHCDAQQTSLCTPLSGTANFAPLSDTANLTPLSGTANLTRRPTVRANLPLWPTARRQISPHSQAQLTSPHIHCQTQQTSFCSTTPISGEFFAKCVALDILYAFNKFRTAIAHNTLQLSMITPSP